MSNVKTQQPTRRDHITDQLSEEEIFDILSNQRRRYAYHSLKQTDDGDVELREVADQVAAWEYEKPADSLTSAERNRVSTALHQFHLPKMDDCGFVEYDAQRGNVQLSERVTDLEVYLDVVPGPDIPWGLYYLGLAGLNTAVLIGVLIDVFPFSLLVVRSWLVFVVASLVISAVAHYYLTRRMRIGSTDAPPNQLQR